jgi:membrane peptidoglycan carboxypeptidase
MLELAQAYSQLSSTGDQQYFINPILSITDPQGNIIYQKEQNQQSIKKVIPDSVAQNLRDILSNKDYMPEAWWAWRLLPLDHFALKTGTTDKKLGTQSLPRDARMVLYTDQDVIVGRAGNTNGAAM